ncbi:MAG: hypothetical protein M3Q65_11030 [Chloroflexota bacterium]|nr:hypothetical protein [Chloroflexota bacterium]
MAMENPVTKRVRRALFHPKNVGLLTASGGAAALALGVGALPAIPAAVVGAFVGLGAWVFSVYHDTTTPGEDLVKEGGGGFDERARRRILREIDEQLEEITKAAQARRLKLSPDFIQRRYQLRRIVDLERQIATELPQTEGTISTLPGDIQEEVRQFVDRAIDLSKLRTAMLRAFVRTNEHVLQQELETIRGRYNRTTGPAKADLETLVQAKEEQLEAFRRLRDDLVSTEAQLDAIEAFLNTVTYGQSLTVGSVRQQMIRLKTKIEARRQSAEEVQRLVNGLER